MRSVFARHSGVAVLAIVLVSGLAVSGASAQPSAAQPEEPAAAVATEPGAAAPDPGAAVSDRRGLDLDRALARFAQLDFDLARALDSTRLDLDSARRRFEVAQERLDAAAEPDASLREEVAARRLQLEISQRMVVALEGRIARLKTEQESLGRLVQLEEATVAPQTLSEWKDNAESLAGDLDREQAIKRGRLVEVEADLSFTRKQLDGLPAADPTVRWTLIRARSLQDLAQSYQADLASLESARRLEAQVMEALVLAAERMPWRARLQSIAHDFRMVWNYELTGSAQEPITPGKITTALVIFLLGWFVARLFSRTLGSRLFPRLRMEEGAGRAFESLAFYFLLLVAFLTALRIVQIPLTAFAVLGGALAIGVGFGSQNVVNNFISGIILLAERPIKLGDLIEVQGVYGNVERIGLRSTRVRTGDNVHIIVPNASFLESNVVNWTHSDRQVRVTLEVGVAYGSPTRVVERMLVSATKERDDVLKTPEPVAIFTDFGDNALCFEVRFWIEMRTILVRLRIESEVRHRIDELFREAGIVIAFPQRDVHLDSLSPVEVKLVRANTEEDDEGEA